MSLDAAIISYAVSKPKAFSELRAAGITPEHFTDDYAKAWKWLTKTKRDHGTIPSKKVVETRFPNVDLHKVRDRDIPPLLQEMLRRKKFIDLLEAVEQASRCDGPEEVEETIQALQRDLNSLSVRDGRSSMVDLFSKDVQKRMLADQKRRRSGEIMGLPTGLRRFDAITGGLQKGRMTVLMARPGKGKSWLNLLFVANAVKSGAKVGLYPLEMSLEDTALRLFTIFSCQMFGPGKALRNLDLTNGRVSKGKVVKLLNLLEDKYDGQLFVADIGSMSDPYTVERVEAEQEIFKFDLQWIDYITLMKAPGVGRDGGEDFTTVKVLSNGIKQIAVRHDIPTGVSSQVARTAISGRALLPRLEHIAYGDSIGQDADHVIPINRKGEYLYYGMVKNRHGPEIGKTRVRFDVDRGDIEETKDQPDDDDDDD